MAFENVDVGSLRSSLNSCKNTINYSAGKEFMSSASGIWQGDAKDNLMRALDKLYNEKYKKLEEKIDYFLGVVGQIENYKRLEGEKAQLASEIEALKPNLYKEVEKTKEVSEWYQDLDGTWKEKKTTEHYTEKVLNQAVQNQINEKLSQMEQKQLEMNGIESTVNSMV
ncbi:MAG: hypothetical protein IKN87_00210 [Bacilli bacterium]|nr:hypothetical protein [Bacilli bacterium]